jgi:hypothetical protein
LVDDYDLKRDGGITVLKRVATSFVSGEIDLPREFGKNCNSTSIADGYDPMKRLSTLALSAVLLLASNGAFADCTCGPDFCQNDPRIPKALADKKASLAAEFPDRLVRLLDIGDQCYARVTRAPDIFTMWIVDADGNKSSTPWSQENENNARAKLESGELKRFWIFNARRAFSCCGQPDYGNRDDYDSTDDVNTATAIKCELSGAKAKCSG